MDSSHNVIVTGVFFSHWGKYEKCFVIVFYEQPLTRLLSAIYGTMVVSV